MNILITAGGTTEKIDNVRIITNNSTGKLGAAIADALAGRACFEVNKIYYVCGLNSVTPQSDKAHIIRVSSVNDLMRVLKNLLTTEKIDAVIHSMAVSDYTVDFLTTKSMLASSISSIVYQQQQVGNTDPKVLCHQILESAFSNIDTLISDSKVSSDIDDMVIVMRKTPKVIGLIKELQPTTLLVGFKLLSNVSHEVLIDTAYNLLLKNKCDLVLANDLAEITGDNHIGYLVAADKSYETFETKAGIAEGIVTRLDTLLTKTVPEERNQR